jgi:hypothetical protein
MAPRSLLDRSLVCASAFLVLAGIASAGDTKVFFEDNFPPSWTATKIVDTTPGASATFSTQTVGGPGAPYRETTHNFGNGQVVVAHYDPANTHTPSTQGTICSIDLGWYLVHSTAGLSPGAFGFRLGVLQGTSWYGAPLLAIDDALWAGYIQSGLRSLDFSKVSGPGPERPDFSCTGTQLTFGFLTDTATPAISTTKVGGTDGWQVTLNLGQREWSDGTFTPSNWTSFKILDTTQGQSATYTIQTPPTGGNPNAYRETTHNYSTGAIAVGHLNVLAVHNPAVEPIYAVSFSADLAHLTNPPPPFGAVGYRVLIRQFQAWYASISMDTYFPQWQSYALNNLVAADFTLFAGAGTLHPDFTSTGQLLEFGYITANSVGQTPSITRTSGIDNWKIVAKTVPICVGAWGVGTCTGDDLGNPCPCYPTIPAGGAGRGCPNSVEALGARLTASGNATISNDTMVLYGFGMPDSSVLYFQGTSSSNTPFGDGRRCATGSVIRLGTRAARRSIRRATTRRSR